MTEPIDPPIRAPIGGWPKLMMRVEVIYRLDREQAYYELACLARRWRIGVVALIDGVDVHAFPHQTANEIAWGHLHQIKAMTKGAERMLPAGEAA